MVMFGCLVGTIAVYLCDRCVLGSVAASSGSRSLIALSLFRRWERKGSKSSSDPQHASHFASTEVQSRAHGEHAQEQPEVHV